MKLYGVDDSMMPGVVDRNSILVTPQGESVIQTKVPAAGRADLRLRPAIDSDTKAHADRSFAIVISWR